MIWLNKYNSEEESSNFPSHILCLLVMFDFNIKPNINFRLTEMKPLALQFSKRKELIRFSLINQRRDTHILKNTPRLCHDFAVY